jgi:hypothetical protein
MDGAGAASGSSVGVRARRSRGGRPARAQRRRQRLRSRTSHWRGEARCGRRVGGVDVAATRRIAGARERAEARTGSAARARSGRVQTQSQPPGAGESERPLTLTAAGKGSTAREAARNRVPCPRRPRASCISRAAATTYPSSSVLPIPGSPRNTGAPLNSLAQAVKRVPRFRRSSGVGRRPVTRPTGGHFMR